jgi:hypothetical protein
LPYSFQDVSYNFSTYFVRCLLFESQAHPNFTFTSPTIPDNIYTPKCSVLCIFLFSPTDFVMLDAYTVGGNTTASGLNPVAVSFNETFTAVLLPLFQERCGQE